MRVVLWFIINQNYTLLNGNLDFSQVLLTPDKVGGHGAQISIWRLAVVHALLYELVVPDFVLNLVADVGYALYQFLRLLKLRILSMGRVRFLKVLIV